MLSGEKKITDILTNYWPDMTLSLTFYCFFFDVNNAEYMCINESDVSFVCYNSGTEGPLDPRGTDVTRGEAGCWAREEETRFHQGRKDETANQGNQVKQARVLIWFWI